MLPDEPQPVDEKKILTTQYVAIGIMVVLFIALSNTITNQTLFVSITTLPLLFARLSIKFLLFVLIIIGGNIQQVRKQSPLVNLLSLFIL